MSPTLPLATLLYALAAYLSLFLTSGGVLWFLVILGVILPGSYVLRARLPLIWLPSLLLSGFLLGLATVLTPQDGPGTPTMIGGARAGFLTGQSAAIVVFIQFYRPVPQDPIRPRLFAFLASTFILLISCNTYDESPIRNLTPFIVLLGGLSLRGGRTRRARDRWGIGLVALAFVLTFGLSFSGTKIVNDHRETLLEWGNRLLGERPQQELGGMSQQPILGPRFGLRGSAARVLRLQGKPRVVHLRGLSYDTYGDGRWWPVVTSRGFQQAEPRTLEPPVPSATLSTLREITVTRLTSDNIFLYAPLNAVQLPLEEGDQADWAPDDGGPFRVRAAAPYTYLYREGLEHAQGLLAKPALRTPQLLEKHRLIAPELRDALAPLAKTITQGATTPQQKVDAVTAYLLENYPYSLVFQPGRGDPVVRFLTQTPHRGAHCEIFASSAALLLRCVGIPTRYVTGYFAHDTQPDGTILVRQRDAHAWCEAWIEGQGWVTVEATPPTGWPEQDKTPVEPWRRLWEGIQDRWFQLVVWLGEREPSQLFFVVGTPPVLVFLFFLWRRRGKRSARATAPWEAPPPELKEIVARFEAALTRAGYPLSANRPWSEQVTTLPEPLNQAVVAFLALYLPTRFGKNPRKLGALTAALDAVEQAVRNPVSREKRNP